METNQVTFVSTPEGILDVRIGGIYRLGPSLYARLEVYRRNRTAFRPLSSHTFLTSPDGLISFGGFPSGARKLTREESIVVLLGGTL